MKEIKMIFPCKIDWKTMPEKDTGKYCGECKKTINDYTSANPEEFKSSVFCGQFRSDQLSYHKSEYEIRNFKTISLSLLTLLGAAAPAQEMKGQTYDQVSNEVVVGKFSNLKFPLKMEGTIRDKVSREVISKATVTLLQLNSVVSTAKTDSSGYFSFLLLEKDIKDSVFDVRVSYQDTSRYYMADTLLKVPVLTEAIEKNAVFSIDFLIKPVELAPLTPIVPTVPFSIVNPTFTVLGGFDGRPYIQTGGVVSIVQPFILTPPIYTVTTVFAEDTIKPKIRDAKFKPGPVSKQKIKKEETETSDPKTNRFLIALVAFFVFLFFRFKKFKS